MSNQENDLKAQVRSSMEVKDTEELLNIWRTNNRKQWSDTAFEAVHDILMERLGSVPPQDQPAEEPQPSAGDSPTPYGDFFHNTDKALSISYWAGVLSWVVLIVFVFYALSGLYFNYLNGMQFTGLYILSAAIPLVISLAVGGILFVFLQGISHGLLILLDIAVDLRGSVERGSSSE